jgi:3-isopropylmalate/(R)-2-methylmalate dehydratase small subunit
MLPIRLDEATVADLFTRAKKPGYKLTVDLNDRTITDDAGLKLSFEVDGFRRHCLLNGLDDIGLTLENEDKITAYEKAHAIAS